MNNTETFVVKVKSNSDDVFNPVKFDDLDLAILTHFHSTGLPHYLEKLMKRHPLLDEFDFKTIYHEIFYSLYKEKEVPFPARRATGFTFIDLFAGIGGFRMACQNLGGKCLFTSEWDKYSKKTYFSNYGDYPFGDITRDDIKDLIPLQFDLLCGGFPCQPFSLAGVSKKNSLGRRHGFEDEKQGNLFFHIAEIIEKHRPKAFFLENVKNLVSHDNGNTFKIIKEILVALDYSFDSAVIDGALLVPQHRERTFIVGFDRRRYGNDKRFDFRKIKIEDRKMMAKSVLLDDVDPKYTLSDNLWQYLQEYARKHKEKGNGFGYGLVDPNHITRTMSARYHKDGAEILIPQADRNPRRLTPPEAAALQGYPIFPINTQNVKRSLRIPVSDTQAYRQFGNSVVMPLIQKIGHEIVKML